MNLISPQYADILFLITGILIRYIISRRRFNRRGIGGLQHYSNYERAVLTTFFEGLFKWISNALIAYALYLMLFS